ncbi:uncharacterized protein LOC128280447 [Gossypium arboreum]|uniref:uncharacterized protein LOC128280447 n=1 Tax=Gossypium arboreum TaxID=29729 RepID=UPI0022F16812|nr:uncharacterized protein LOC128280447 [Gossypium arboreum]
MLRSCVIDFRGNWKEYFLLVEFTYNNNFQSSIQIAPYEALCGRKCRTLSCWAELGERRTLGSELISEIKDKVRLIRDSLKVASDRQKSYANLKRREIEYSMGDFVFLKVSPWKNVLSRCRSDPTHIVSMEEIKAQILDHGGAGSNIGSRCKGSEKEVYPTS